jgi:hypothetical protein
VTNLVSIALTGIAVAISIAYLTDELRRHRDTREPSARAEAARMLAALVEAAARQPANAGPPVVVAPPPAPAPATTVHTQARALAVITVLAALHLVQLLTDLTG